MPICILLGFELQCSLCFRTAPIFWTSALYYLWILGTCRSPPAAPDSELQRESLRLNGFWIHGCGRLCGEMYYLLPSAQKKTTIQKANVGVENITSRSGRWLPQSQDKYSYYNNSAVPFPSLSYVIQGQQIIVGSSKEQRIEDGHHVLSTKSYARARNSKAPWYISQRTRFYQSVSQSDTSGPTLCQYMQWGHRSILFFFLAKYREMGSAGRENNNNK